MSTRDARWDRLLGFAVLVPSAALLGLSHQLVPDPTGMGTHHQMGLGTCTILSMTGWPCPTCGMTTTFALAADGRLLAAFVNQPFGFALFLGTALAAGLGLADLLVPRRRLRRVGAWVWAREGIVALALLLGMLLGWVWKLALVQPWGG